MIGTDTVHVVGAADIPILPALHAQMTAAPDAHRCPGPVDGKLLGYLVT
jgi:hypothetical protein